MTGFCEHGIFLFHKWRKILGSLSDSWLLQTTSRASYHSDTGKFCILLQYNNRIYSKLTFNYYKNRFEKAIITISLYVALY
jgi:hypothetical protein